MNTHPKFKALCRNVECIAPQLGETNLLEVLKILSFLGVPTNSDVILFLLDAVQCRTEKFSMKSIIFFSFLLRKQTQLPIVKSLRSWLPGVFQSQMELKDLSCEDLPSLLGYLNYVGRSAEKMSAKSIETIIKAVLSHRDNFTKDNALSSLWSMLILKQLLPPAEELLDHSVNMVVKSIDEIKPKDLTPILSRMAAHVTERRNAFYSEKFCSRLVEKIIQEKLDLTDAVKVANDLQKMVSI